MSFTFQKYSYPGNRTEKRSYVAKVRGKVDGDSITLVAYEAIQGNVMVPTEYTGKVTNSGRMSGQWEHAPGRVAGRFDFALLNDKP